MESELDTFKALVPAGTEYVVNDRPYVGPQILIPINDHEHLSCIGEIDITAIGRITPNGQFALVPDQVEIALVSDGSVSAPLRHRPIAVAADIVRRVLAGDRSDFEG